MLNARTLTESYLRNLLDSRPLEALEALAELDRHMTSVMAPHVHAARTAGATWDEVGQALGTSRQGAFNRFNGTSADQPSLF